jgi:hypothetical protein
MSEKPITQKLDKATDQKLDTVVPKLVRMLGMLTSSADGEVLTTVYAFLQVLTDAGLDIHALRSRIEHGKYKEKEEENKQLSAAEMQKIYDAAYAQGHADGIETGRRSAIIAAAMPMGIIDSSDVGSGVNGHSWLEIAQYCADNKHRVFRDKDRQFVDSIFEQIAYRQKTPSPPQAKWLRDIFNQRFGGRID